MASGETGTFLCDGSTVDTQAGASELDGNIMASVETEVFEYGSFPSTAQASKNKDDGTTMASAETEAFDTVHPVDAQEVGSVHDGIIMALDLDPRASVSVDTVDAVGSEHGSSIGGFGETEGLNHGVYAMASVGTVNLQGGSRYDSLVEADPVTMASIESVDVQEGRTEHDGTVIVSAEREALQCNPHATGSVDTVDVQAGGSEEDVPKMTSVETEASECNPSATSAVGFRVSVEEDPLTSPSAQNVQQEATNLVSGDDQASVTVLGSITDLSTAVAPSMNIVSNQEGSPRSASPADRKEDGKFEQVIVQNMQEIQGEEHAYDIDEFDISVHEVPMTETFFDKHCMFPALDADTSEAWQVAGDDVVMEDSSLEHDKAQQENVDAESISIETDSNIVVNHDVGEKVDTEERQAYTMPVQPSSEAVPMDAVHGLEESSGLKTITASHVQGHVDVGGFQCGELDIGNAQGLASGVVQGEKLLYNAPEDVCAQGINLQCDADDIFMSFRGENMEIAHAAGSYDTEDNNNSVVQVENEAIQIDQDLPGSSCDLGVENTNSYTVSNEEELQRKSQTAVVGTRMEAYKSHEQGATQAEIQDKGTSQDSAPSAIVIEKDECTDLESNDIGVCKQSVEVGKDADLNDFSGAGSANSQFLNLAGNAEPMYAPVNGEQEENAPVIVSSEISIQVVSQALAQEETATPNQNVTHVEATLNNKESEVVHEVSPLEADALHKMKVEKQGDDTLLMGGKSVDEVDGTVLDRRESDRELILKDRDAVAEDKVAGPEHENEAISGQQEELYLRQPVDTYPPQAEIGIDAVRQDLSMKMTTHLWSSSGPGTDVSSCTDFTPRDEIAEGLNDDEKPALQGLVCEESREKKHQVSLGDADAFSKEKRIGGHKSPRLDRSIIESKQGGGEKSGKETDDDSSSSEHEEELSDTKLPRPRKEENAFGIGDLVWAKVRSHPWWPAQIFDPADASKSARKAKKSGRVLVAFFGDRTFAWLQQSQMIAFRSNFKEKVKQTTMRIFCMAVEEALEEFCRRSELGLSCTHYSGMLHCTSSFPDANAGIREGVRVKSHKDIRTTVQMFRPAKTLEFVKGVACSPLGAWSSTLQLAELRGHAYGLRTCMVASGSLDTALLLPNIHIVSSQGSKLKRSHSSLKSEVAVGSDKETKRLTSGKEKRASEGKGPSHISKKRKTGIAREADETVGQNTSIVSSSVDASEGNRDRLSIKFKVSKKIEHDRSPSFERLSDTAAGQEVVSERSSDDGGETLLSLAGKSAKVLKRSSFKEDRDSSSAKKRVRRKSVREMQNRANRAGVSDSEAAASTRTEDGAFAVSAEERLLNAEVIKGKGKKKVVNVTCSPVSSIDAEDVQEGTPKKKRSSVLNIGSRDEMNKAKLKKTLGNEKDARKKEAARKFSKMGDSIRKVAGELTGTPVTKSVDDSSIKSTGPGSKKKMKDLALEPPASPTPTTPKKKKSTEDVSLLQLRQDLELLANKPGSGGGSGKAVKKSKKVDQVEAVGTKSSPHWPHRSQRSCVQELALAARKRKSEISHDEVLAKLPKNSSTAGSERHHTSKAYITSAEKPVERRSYDKNLLHYSRRPAPPASNTKSSSQRYDEKLSSHMPLGLFMRFPEDFPLPSESQLKATFIPFGPLQMSATRLYKDTASAQVVFKHGRDAESALKHAKKNAMFGEVAVTYRLRYLSHSSSRVETKTDQSSPNKAHSSLTAPGRKASSSKEKVGGASASSENRVGHKDGGTSPSSRAQDATLSESEPTGDIQHQMMTLLRQVSVIVNPVNPSPVPAHDT